MLPTRSFPSYLGKAEDEENVQICVSFVPLSSFSSLPLKPLAVYNLPLPCSRAAHSWKLLANPNRGVHWPQLSYLHTNSEIAISTAVCHCF